MHMRKNKRENEILKVYKGGKKKREKKGYTIKISNSQMEKYEEIVISRYCEGIVYSVTRLE
jgi:hypothetical protein